MPLPIETLDDVADKQDLEMADRLIKEGRETDDDVKLILGNKVRQTVAMTRELKRQSGEIGEMKGELKELKDDVKSMKKDVSEMKETQNKLVSAFHSIKDKKDGAMWILTILKWLGGGAGIAAIFKGFESVQRAGGS